MRHRLHSKTTFGFSIIELLAAMTILVIIVGLMSMMMMRVRELWDSTTARERCTRDARAALDALGNDLEQAMTDTNLFFVTSVSTQKIEGLTFNASRLYLVTLTDSMSADERPLAEIEYRVEAETNLLGEATGFNRLVRRSQTFPARAAEGFSPLGPDTIETLKAAPVASGVVGFSVGISTNAAQAAELSIEWDSREDTPRLPLHADIYLELMTREHITQSLQLAAQRKDTFVERHKYRYSRRVAISAAIADRLYASTVNEGDNDE